MQPHETPENGGGDLPPKLVAALREVAERRVFVPATLDEAILRAARERLTPVAAPSRWHGARRWLLWPGIATACACLLLLVHGIRDDLWILKRTWAREDINHDGQVDILDAYQLVRQIEAGQALPQGADLNGNGLVDRRDAELVAAHAVQLRKRNRS